MTNTQIEKLFFETIEETAIYNKLEGISEDKIYNWRKGRGRKPSTGEMLEVLYQLEKIEVKLSTKVPAIYGTIEGFETIKLANGVKINLASRSDLIGEDSKIFKKYNLNP
jgi:hypothetical protein